MLIIPAIDVLNGEVSRLTKGDFSTAKKYEGSILDHAKRYESIGIEWLHLIDLDASVTGNISCLNIIKEIKSKTNLKIEFGGGIKTLANAEKALEYGADKIIIGSISVSNKQEFENIVSKIGSDNIIVAVDTLQNRISIKGWTELSEIKINEHIDYCNSFNIINYLCTDISKDGMLRGANKDLYAEILSIYPEINLIASGGVSGIKDIESLSELNLFGCIVGKAIYENKITLEEIKNFAK